MKCQSNKIIQPLIRQFGRPSGAFGWLAGKIMAHRSSNIERNLWTVSLLDLQPEDVVLEIGFGPGVAVEAAAHRISSGKVVGLDHSPMMWREARRRNRQAIVQGRVELICASVESVSSLPCQFDKVFAVNCLMFWDNPQDALRSIRSKMKEGGLIAVTHQPRGQGAVDSEAHQKGDEIALWLRHAGFHGITREFKPMPPVGAVCVLGRT